MEKLELWSTSWTPTSRFVRATAAELGLQLEIHEVDMKKGANRTPEYLRMNPNGKVPVLKHGDFTLWESTAICRYLVGLVQASTLLPRDARSAALVDQWLAWKLSEFYPAFGTIMGELVVRKIFGAGEPDKKNLEKATADFERSASVLEKHLETRSFVVGDELTLADVSLAAAMTLRHAAQYDLSRWPNLLRWLERIEARPSFKTTAPRI